MSFSKTVCVASAVLRDPFLIMKKLKIYSLVEHPFRCICSC